MLSHRAAGRETGAVPTLRIDRLGPPVAGDAAAIAVAVRLVARAQAVGALPLTVSGDLDADLLGRALGALQEAGIGAARPQVLTTASPAADCTLVLTAVDEELERTPLPDGTWAAMVEVLGVDLLAELVGVPAARAAQHLSSAVATPLPVARRLHVVALLVADLAGAYDDSGVARWFVRPRHLLDGSSPLDVLRGGFDPEGPEVEAVRGLVDALAAVGAT